VVYRADTGAAPQILLIRDQYGRWTIPKGHLDPGETEEQAAVREVREETGVVGDLGAFIGVITYQVTKRREAYQKQVAFFLMRAKTTELTPQASEGISAIGWFTPQEALERIGYPQVYEIVDQGLRMLSAP
jgi:8-oxo-dGTP pyrophosphatase MutT (NUDIX family)